MFMTYVPLVSHCGALQAGSVILMVTTAGELATSETNSPRQDVWEIGGV